MNARKLIIIAALVGLPVFTLLAGSPAHAECDAECVWLMLKNSGLDVCSRPIAQLNVEQLNRCQASNEYVGLYRALQDPEFRRRLDEQTKADREARSKATEAAAEAARTKAAEEAARKKAAEQAEQRRYAMPHNDPGAIDLCPPPHRVTGDGCK